MEVKTELDVENKDNTIKPILEIVKSEIGNVTGNSLILNYTFTELYEIWEKATTEMRKMIAENDETPEPFPKYYFFILQLQLSLREKLPATEKMVKNVKGWVDPTHTPII